MIRLYDKNKIDFNNLPFSNKDLWLLLVPIVVEQMLNSFMGMADSMMVAKVGTEAISAVSLVDSVNILIIQVFAALATGAAIICSQYVGLGKKEGCIKAARQITLTVFAISIGIVILSIVFNRSLLSFIFGHVEDSVMEGCVTYFYLSVLSYPFIALFSAGSAFFRAEGNSKLPMKISVISNVINIIGNAIFIFGFNMGVFGAGLATLLSRFFCFAVIFYRLRDTKQLIYVKNYFSIRPDWKLIGTILAIGIPSGVENGMFQFGKLAIQSTVSTLGTKAIAAQAMAAMFENINGIGACGVGIGLMTVVGQCIGAGKKEEAKYYMIKHAIIAEVVVTASCLLVIVIAKPVLFLAGYGEHQNRQQSTCPARCHLCVFFRVGQDTVKKERHVLPRKSILRRDALRAYPDRYGRRPYEGQRILLPSSLQKPTGSGRRKTLLHNCTAPHWPKSSRGRNHNSRGRGY